ncbi:MAG: ABC transporter permease [Candidatus Aminicenantes bacterium]|jgi:ABC-type antimicrobial peptide transport system permease subunit
MCPFHKPPRIPEWIIERLSLSDDEFFLTGDLREEFEDLVAEKTLAYARIWYWFQLLKSLPSFLKNSIIWSVIMIKNYLKIAIRNLRKYRGYSFINIFGLAVGLATCILILLWVQDEVSYDRFHTNLDSLYRIACYDRISSSMKYSVTSPPIAPALEQNFPEILRATRYEQLSNQLIKVGEKKFPENEVSVADPAFLEMFSFPLIQGNSQTALTDPYTALVTESTARKYFGQEDPVGKVLSLGGRFDIQVTGVLKDLPPNSHLQFSILMPVKLLEDLGWNLDNWERFFIHTYIQIHPESAPIDPSKIQEVYEKGIGEQSDILFELLPVKDIHLRSAGIWGYGADGNIRNVYLFSIIAIFVLLIACVNFMNLSTARSGDRAKEVGMRKVVGAHRKDIIQQFFGESMLLAFIALGLSLIFVSIILPVFNTITAKDMTLDISTNASLLMFFVGIALITGLISGIYPALLLSGFKPVVAFKEKSISTKNIHSLFRKILVVAQFSLSIALIIGTGIIYSQLDYMQQKELGFNQDHVVCMNLTPSLKDKYGVMKEELLRLPGVSQVTTASGRPFAGFSSTTWESRDGTKHVDLFFTHVDTDFCNTFGMAIANGRFFSKDFSIDKESYVLNETAVRQMELENPLGEQIEFHEQKGTVIGVIKDYHFLSLHSKIAPLLLTLSEKGQDYMSIKVVPGNLRSTLDEIGSVWSRFERDYPFQYTFINEEFDRMYRAEIRFRNIFGYFAGLAIVISCLGLFGLASFMAEKRTKEIGVRKVLGASVSGIAILLAKEFTKWVVVANAVAWPLAYWTMKEWLAGFAYRTEMGIGIFLISGGLALVVAWITVGYKSVRAALTNPVDCLRYE